MKLSYPLKSAIITTLIGIIGWIVFISTSQFGGGEGEIGRFIYIVIAIISIIPLWLIGLLIGWLISKKR